MEKLHILQFEYQTHGMKVFVQVHNTFKHHYTGETMRYVQLDWMDRGSAVTTFETFNEAEFKRMYEARVKEPDDET